MTDDHRNDMPPIRPLLLRVAGRGGRRLSCHLHGGSAEQVRRLLKAPAFCSDAASAFDQAVAGVGAGRDRLLRALAHPQHQQRILDSQELLRDLWRADRGLTPERFCLRPDPGDGQPLAFLLALADGLQDWDRPRFTAPRFPGDIGLIDQEVMLVAGNGKVHLAYEVGEEEAVARFAALRRELGERLHGIDRLLSRGVAAGQAAPPLPVEQVAAPQLAPSQVDLGPYLQAILAECGSIELRGIMPSGRTRQAVTMPIEELFAPLQVEGDDDDLWQLLVDPQRHSGRLAGLGEEVTVQGQARERRQVLLLVGDPGSGKSTFLRMTAAVLAHALRDEPWALVHPASRAFLARAAGELPVPVFIRLSRLAEFLQAADRRQAAVDAPALLRQYLQEWVTSRSAGLGAGELETWLRQGRALVLLDGLDEIPGRALRERVEQIVGNALAAGVYGACRFCLTSRPLQTEGYPPVLLPRRICGLSDGAIEHFLACWAGCVGRSGAAPVADPQAYTADLLAQARAASPAIREMLRNPLMLTCLAVIHWNERRLPEQRAELLDAIVTWLLRARPEAAGEQGGEHWRRRVFQALALAMHCAEGGRVRELDLAAAAAAVSDCCSGDSREQRLAAARQLLEQEVVASGIITPTGRDSLQLWHLSFQELLVADLLRDHTEKEWPAVLTAERLADPAWREVVLLLAGLLGNSNRARALLRLILEPAAKGSLADKARCYGLARAVVQDLQPYRFVPDQDLGLDQLGHQVLRIFTPAAVDVPLAVRVEAAEALGRAGDPRLQEERWVETRPGLWFGVYPVTVQEYARFVDDGGYDPGSFGGEWLDGWRAGIEDLLSDDSYKFFWERAKRDRERRQPDGWQQQLATPNRPVVSVSWFEVDAYCRWLSQPQEAWAYRLPTETEWEYAARGAAGNPPYPWGGDEPGKGDTAKANYDGAGIGKPSPVGLFPAGAADWGESGLLHDMAGNVWEWCCDELGRDGKPKRGGPERPLRGGSYWYDATSLVVTARVRNLAASWFVNVGFRVVRCRARARPPVDG